MINGTTPHVPSAISTVTPIVKHEQIMLTVVEDIFATVSSKAEV